MQARNKTGNFQLIVLNFEQFAQKGPDSLGTCARAECGQIGAQSNKNWPSLAGGAAFMTGYREADSGSGGWRPLLYYGRPCE